MIQRFSKEHLSEVVEMHYKVLNWSINSRLGKHHIHNLYNTLLNDENAVGFVYIIRSQIFGVVTGTLCYKKTRKKLKYNYTFTDKLKLASMMLNLRNAIYIFENVFSIPSFLNKNSNIDSQIITLVTRDDETIRPFAGVQCFTAIRSFFRKNGVKEVFAQVASFDSTPNNFYRKGLRIKPIKRFYTNYFYKIEI